MKCGSHNEICNPIEEVRMLNSITFENNMELASFLCEHFKDFPDLALICTNFNCWSSNWRYQF